MPRENNSAIAEFIQAADLGLFTPTFESFFA